MARWACPIWRSWIWGRWHDDTPNSSLRAERSNPERFAHLWIAASPAAPCNDGEGHDRMTALIALFWRDLHRAWGSGALWLPVQIGRASCRERVCQYG